MSDVEAVAQLSEIRDQIYAEVGKVVIGQKQIVEELLIALLSGGHCLLVGVPGLAKTTLIQTLARTLDLSFGRIQFTPDLMPSDITGTEVLEEDAETGHKAFRFIRGPLFANVILADEINRTPPKTQAALLQAMQEHAVTAGGETMTLDEPFFVLATQNPIEQEGTYPLPEAQLDRFIFELWIDYPDQNEEEEIVRQTTSVEKAEVAKVVDAQRIVELQELVRRVPVADHCIRYAVELVRASRPTDDKAPDYVREMVNWGAGPRASQYLVLAAKARAILAGRHSVAIEDIQAVARPVMRHRIVVNFHAEAQNINASGLIDRLLTDVEPES
ncbi:MAG: MoxR family ATPase [Candidatus Latescibacterota bacterium]|nr:MoxR family ATPase [Candidatus Latescibacterota bacterium]